MNVDGHAHDDGPMVSTMKTAVRPRKKKKKKKKNIQLLLSEYSIILSPTSSNKKKLRITFQREGFPRVETVSEKERCPRYEYNFFHQGK